MFDGKCKYLTVSQKSMLYLHDPDYLIHFSSSLLSFIQIRTAVPAFARDLLCCIAYM